MRGEVTERQQEWGREEHMVRANVFLEWAEVKQVKEMTGPRWGQKGAVSGGRETNAL